MKKIIVLLLLLCFMLTGCGKNNERSIVGELEKKLSKMKSYQINGELTVHNNDDIYRYDIDVFYLKDDYYRVEFTNTSNDHRQILLKNEDGLYVLTPSLNKSFRFQSEWPNKNSQIYLINTIIQDIIKSKNRQFEIKNEKYIFSTDVDYPNNKKLVSQKILFDKNLKPIKISVLDENGIEKMVMEFKKVKYSPKIDKTIFDIDTIMDSKEKEKIDEVGVLEDIIYPLFLPNGTKLVNEDVIQKDHGERVIMSYDGEKSFVLVEETADVFDEFTVIPTSGEPSFLMDSLGVVSDNSLSWTSSGIDYYLVSSVMSQEELVEVAQSIGGTLSIK